jgi:RHS repeat-associated protein
MRIQQSYNQCFTHPYSFQAQEHDDEVKGDGNSVNYTFRIHDPRLGRFFVLDPLASEFPHNSPYAFSENKVIHMIELEGREAKKIAKKLTKTVLGPVGYARIIKQADLTAAYSLLLTARKINPNVGKESNEVKIQQLENDANATVALMLYEFATGTGRDNRTFEKGKHAFADKFLEGRVMEEIKSDFYEKAAQITYLDFTSMNAGSEISFGLEFSPDHAGLQKSIEKHLNSNLPQFFIGGANVVVTPTLGETGKVDVSITNSTSRSSLMLHLAGDNERDGTDFGHQEKRLSTIRQTITFTMEIDTTKFKEEAK